MIEHRPPINSVAERAGTSKSPVSLTMWTAPQAPVLPHSEAVLIQGA